MKLPLTLLGPALATVVGAAGSYMVTKEQVAEVTKTSAATATQVDKLRDQGAEDRERLKGIETDVKYIGQALERVERHLGTK